jgi:hypothetical protein
MSDTTNLGLPFLAAAQAQKHVTHNEALLRLDALLHLSVLTRGLSEPPAVLEEGARYLIAEATAGEWSSHSGEIAAWQDGAWSFFKARPGWRVWIEDEAALLVYANAGWMPIVEETTVTSKLGISANADDYNRLIVSAPASLFNHAGAGHQLKLNKSDTRETASLLFQTGYSGRAELGLAGDDHLHVKVSADGASWIEAIRIDNASGIVAFPAGLGGAQTLGEVIVASPGADSHNFDPDGWNTGSRATQIHLTPSQSVRLTGLVGGAAARLAVLANAAPRTAASARLLILEHDSFSSSAENRFAFCDSLPRLLMPGDSIALLYDAEAFCWRELTPQRLAATFEIFSDAYSVHDFETSASGSASAAQSGSYLAGDVAQKPRGICRLGTGSSQTGAARWGMAEKSIVPAQGCSLYLVRLAVEALSTATERFQIRAGWHDGDGFSVPANGIYWEYDDHNSGSWSLCASAGGSATRVASPLAVDTNYAYLGIFLNGNWSRADFFSSSTGRLWSFHGALEQNLPSSLAALGFSAGIAKSVGLTERNLSIDMQAMRYDVPGSA